MTQVGLLLTEHCSCRLEVICESVSISNRRMTSTQNTPPTGTILPPPDIKEKIERTAEFVHRNGVSFENRIREKEKSNAKFSFLNPFDPYHAFYQWRLRQLHAGIAIVQEQKKEVEEKRAEVRKPKEWEFCVKLPPISAVDFDILKLTALYVALHGQTFMLQLSQKESKNIQFDFLRPNHSFYRLFTALVAQYQKVLFPPKSYLSRFKTVNVEALMERAQQRAGYQRWYKTELLKKQTQEASSRADLRSVDWHDFTIVETVVFTEAEEMTELPPPANLNDLQHASLEQKREFSLFNDALRVQEAPPNFDPQDQPAAVVDPSTVRATTVKSVRPSTQAMQPPVAPAPALAQAGGDETINGMRIRHDYVRQSQIVQQTALCPLCKQQIPTAEYEKHMRIEILSPQYTSQRAQFLERSSSTNLAIGDAANNIKRLASQRGDLFDERQEETKRRQVVGFEGFEKNSNRANVDMNEQIRLIHQKIAREQQTLR